MHLKLFSWAVNKKTKLLENPKPLTDQRQTGNWAEALAAAELKRKGYKILARNWMHKNDELDIIAMEAGQLVFVEVRARKADAAVPGYFSLGGAKRTALRRGALAYLHEKEAAEGKEFAWRFDVVEVSYEDRKKYELRHYEGVGM